MNKHLSAIIGTAFAVTGCMQQPQVVTATAESNEGIAKTCTPSSVDLSKGTATITMTNDGWCAVHTKDKTGEPFKFGLVRTRPQHGYILIQKIGGETRIEYTAEHRFVGEDRFSVALASNTPNTPDAVLQVAVSIARGEGVAPATVEPAPRATTPARRTTRS